MNNLTLAAQTIKDTISAQDVGQVMGLEIRHGRCKCPMHGGHDYNCVLYKGDRGYYCHVCKKGGDVISFVREYYHMSFPDAVRWFSDTFGLQLDIDSPMSEEAVKQAEIARKMREEKRLAQEWTEKMRFDLALTADRIVEMLEEQRDRYAPKTMEEPWNRLFCQALRYLPGAKRFAYYCMMECMKDRKEEGS